MVPPTTASGEASGAEKVPMVIRSFSVPRAAKGLPSVLKLTVAPLARPRLAAASEADRADDGAVTAMVEWPETSVMAPTDSLTLPAALPTKRSVPPDRLTG